MSQLRKGQNISEIAHAEFRIHVSIVRLQVYFHRFAALLVLGG